MKKKTILFSLIFSLLFLFACEKTEKLEDFPLYPPKLVLNSFLNTDSTIRIHLSKSLSVLDNANIKNIDNGSIKLYENGSKIATLNTGDGNGYYTFNYNPKIGATYDVEASAPSLGTISSSTPIPSKIAINKFEAEKLNSSQWGTPYKFSITFNDPSGEKNYYMLDVKLIRIDTQMVGNDTFFYENYPYRLTFGSSNNPAIDQIIMGNIFFKDDFFNGKTYSMDANVDYLSLYSYKVKLIASLYSLSEESYKYRLTYGKYIESGDNPFAEPVQVYNNIDGGYGIFGAEALSIDSLIMDGISF